jgi:hypothetical protein
MNYRDTLAPNERSKFDRVLAAFPEISDYYDEAEIIKRLRRTSILSAGADLDAANRELNDDAEVRRESEAGE